MTAGRAHLLISDHTRDCLIQLRCILNIKRLTEEDSIPWFDLYGWGFSEDQDNDTVSSDNITKPVVIGN